jgi:spermidine synthase
MNRHRLELRDVPGGRAFYIDGSLQFDSRDEAVYHEALALPALALAAARFKRPLSALVLGGGDGLALKRLLAGSRVQSADLVDYDPGVLELGRTEFAAYNGGSLSSPRAHVYTRDARRHLGYKGPPYDLALADFTFPEDLAGCSLFTRSFFSAVRARLAAGGVFALNAVSPDRCPAAFWSVYRTLSAARLYPRPLRISIPSFSAHGYGDWGMFLASSRPILDTELRALRLGRGNSWLSAETFRDALRLRVGSLERGLPLSGVIKKPGDLLCLINLQEPPFHQGGELADFGDSAAARRLLAGVPGARKLGWPQLSPEWQWRLLETLRRLDWDSFLAELEGCAADLPEQVLADLRLLREKLPELLKGAAPDSGRAWQVFAVLMTLLVFANMAYPDNAYAKGYSSHGTSGSGGDLEVTFFMQTTRSPFHHPIYQGADVFMLLPPSGQPKPAELLRYRAPEAPAGVREDRLWFALADDAFVSREGELFYSLGPTPYLLQARSDAFVLLDKKLPEPLFEFFPEPGSVQNSLGAIDQHVQAADKALAAYDKWLAWAGPAAALSGEIRANGREADNIVRIRASLLKASERVHGWTAGAAQPSGAVQPGWQRLAPGLYLVDEAEITLLRKDGELLSYPYLGERRMAYPLHEPTPELDAYVTAILAWRSSQLGSVDPRKAVLEVLLEAKAKR